MTRALGAEEWMGVGGGDAVEDMVNMKMLI